jgi:hypothetical protein
MTNRQVLISTAVEGLADEAVVRRLIREAGGKLARAYGRSGKAHLRERIAAHNHAARFGLWVVLVDLDEEADCAPPLRATWLPHPEPMMCFRVAVREIEAWLLADREALAGFLGVAPSRIPLAPEAVPDPKRTMVDLARHSRRREIRDDMVPRAESGRPIGEAYTSRLIEFVESHWRPRVAAQWADSLRRCCQRLNELVNRQD